MLTEAADFKAESDALHALLQDKDDADFERPTLFKDWSVNDVMGHLHIWNHAVNLSVTDEAAFDRFVQAFRDAGSRHFPYTHEWSGGLKGQALLGAWYGLCQDMEPLWRGLDPETRVKWVGPPMTVRMSIVARQMETWAHGQEVFDAFGVARHDEDRIRNIAELGVRTFGFTFANRKIERPAVKPYVRLTGPSGAVWTWNEESDTDYVAGAATDFCQVVTQTRNIADVGLEARGDAATRWMAIAQCFAGGPNDPPPPGARHTVS